MTEPPRLFDQDLRARRRARAARGGATEPMRALQAHAADDLADRLALVSRPLETGVLLGAGDGAIAAQLRAARPGLSLRAFETEPALVAAAHAAGRAVTLGDGAAERPGEADLVLSVHALHAADDPIAALAAARRMLKPDGLLIARFVGGETLSELRAALAEAEVEQLGGLSPRVSPMAELRSAGALLQRAGYALPVADSDRATLWYRSMFELMRDLRALGETNHLLARHRAPTPRRVFLRAAALYAERHAREDGRIPATVEMVTLTGWSPGPDQPQPLRPGSATTRLADALGAEERSAGEKAGR